MGTLSGDEDQRDRDMGDAIRERQMVEQAAAEGRFRVSDWPLASSGGVGLYGSTGDDLSQQESDTLRAAADILDRDAHTLDDAEATDGEFARLIRAAKTCRVASNMRGQQ